MENKSDYIKFTTGQFEVSTGIDLKWDAGDLMKELAIIKNNDMITNEEKKAFVEAAIKKYWSD
ncbi:hypothetical protein [Alkaliphilus peptidifermentans]|uniref:Uncharacterized protein n=1 Tax=Alkaliphilus peptidifermentans DSM 18978 TaxID=1120976 RepID=A0A1G5GFG1_9FIRM|nr:hypothetical protein [Alkaliphilus peptidifermentans]SCY50312.1 hypothetical protein SAMN03080606_01672 [Alkaliphilus peptidifermentans DSM 18978]